MSDKDKTKIVSFVGRRCPEDDYDQYIYFEGDATEEFTEAFCEFLEEQGFTELL